MFIHMCVKLNNLEYNQFCRNSTINTIFIPNWVHGCQLRATNNGISFISSINNSIQ